MAKDDQLVRLQVNIRLAVRRKLKAVAVEHGLEMGDVADAILDHVLPLITSGKAPAEVLAALEKVKKSKGEADSDA